MIALDKVSLRIKKTEILKGISAEFDDGQIHGIVGRNGSGKTMLMKCICGFVRPTGGKVTINDKVVGKDMDFPDNMGIIIENPGFIPYYSGLKNLKELAALNKKVNTEQIQKYMEMVGLEPGLRRPVKKYSLGMRQRLGIAQAIMENPSILMLDEPFNGLDIDGVEQMRKVMLRLKAEGKNVILASHNTEDIEILCDTVHEIKKGHMTKIYDRNQMK